MSEDGLPQPIEFFIASDASAIVEHTKRVLYLEDDDIAHIARGELHIHRLRSTRDGTESPAQASATRSIETLEIEIAEIMKGKFDHFMQKEISSNRTRSSTPCAGASTSTRTRSSSAG